MSEIGHSTLLKFFVNTSKMSEQSVKTDSSITSKVPGEQALRGDYIYDLQNENVHENNIATKNYSLSPIIKVTKEESTFTKGDIKVQKVVVSEDISDEAANTNRKLTKTESTGPTENETEEHSEVSTVTINTNGDTQTTTGDQKVVYKVTKIPKLKFNQVVNKIKKEEEMMKQEKNEAELELKVMEAKPNLKYEKNLLQELCRADSIQQDSPKVDDEFDRIYDEIFENGPPSGNFPSPGKIEDPDKLETKFEEIIHSYDEQKAQTTNSEKVKSKIPMLKRKSEHDIFAARQTIRKNSLKKQNSVDDIKCKLPVPLIKEKQNFELELSQKNIDSDKKIVSAKNATVFETVNTNISKSLPKTAPQKGSESYITQETQFISIPKVSKSKIPTHFKNIVAVENVSDDKTSESSSKWIIEKGGEDRFLNTENKNKIQEPKPVTEDSVKTLNVKDNISNINTESIIITDNVKKVLKTNENDKKDTKINITVEKDTGNKNQVIETGTKTHIVEKVDVNNLKPINDSTPTEKPLDGLNSNNDFHKTNKNSENAFSKTEEQKILVNETNSNVLSNQEVKKNVEIVSLRPENSIQQDQQNKTHIVKKVDVNNLKPINDSTPTEKQLDGINSNNDFYKTNKNSENTFSKTEEQKILVNETNSSVSSNQEGRETVEIVSPRSKNSIQQDQQNKIHIVKEVDVNNLKPINDSTQTEKLLDGLNSNNDFHKTNKNSENAFSKTEEQKILVNETNSNVLSNQEVKKILEIVSLRSENSTQQDQQNKTHIVKKVDVNHLKPISDSIQTDKPLDGINSNNDFHKLNKNSENAFSKTEVQKILVNETNSNDLSNQEVKETVQIVPLRFSDSESKDFESENGIQQDQQNKTSDNIPKNIPKNELHISETNQLVNNSQEIAYDDSKNKPTDENTKSANINIDNKSATNITEKVSLKVQDVVSQDLSRSNNERNINNLSQKYTINKLTSESIQKSLDSSLKTSRVEIGTENNKEVINSTTIDTKQDKEILVTNQQSEAKVQPKDITKELTKTLTTQEHPNKSENVSKQVTTEINNNEIKTEVSKDNKLIKVIASNTKVNSTENNGKDISELEEEDIIILKGKVSRIINRLDSKEIKINKCELDDLPREESIVSKIALFEQSNSVDTTTSNYHNKVLIAKTKPADDINLNKPKIVDEVLKTESGSLSSDSNFSYDTFLNYKKNIKNSISSNENEVQTISKAKSITTFDKIYKTNINLNKFNKTKENKVGCSEDEVFLKNEKASRNIINEYKINKEIDLDMRRAKSLAELNYDGVQGRVRQMVVRMNSIDKMALERREQNEVRKKTRHGSVSDRIALFEQDANEQTVHLMKKVTPIRLESVSTTTCPSKPEDFTPALTEEELAKRITELAQARVTYGHYDNMTYIELSDGGRLPSLAVGTALLDSRLVKPVIKAAIDLGYRAIDTAYIYGNEQAVGEAIREKIQDGTVKREELFVLSKLWSTNHRHDLVSRACKQSLEIMGLDYFDLYLIHNPMSLKEGPNPVPKIANVLQYSEHDYLEAWFGIESLIKQGLVKRGGVSNFNSVQVERVLDKGKIKPVVNQVECHPYLSQARLQDYMSSRGVAMSCFGSLGSSGTPRALRSALSPVINDPLVRTMAAGLGISPAQLLISYQVSLGRNVVVKASNAAHLWDNLHALDHSLAPAHAAGLAALNRNKRTFTYEGMGDTHKNYPFKIPF